MKTQYSTKPVFIWLFLCVIVLSSCNSDKQISGETNNNVRLITLAPHLAELVHSAGAVDNLVGVVAYSDFPKEVESIDLVGDSFKLDYEKIITLQPDYILTWKGGTPIAVIEKLRNLNFDIVETEINTLSDIPKTISQIAELTNTKNQAITNIVTFNKSIQKIKEVTFLKQSIFIETYHKPLYTVSGKHWMSEATELCGYQNIFKDMSQLSAPITLEAVITKNPQAILNISPQEDLQWNQWKNLEAIKLKNIMTIHPDLFSRPSMRILQGIEKLCHYKKSEV